MKTLISAVVCAAALVSAPAFASKDLATAKGIVVQGKHLFPVLSFFTLGFLLIEK